MTCRRTGAALFVTSVAMFVVSPGVTAQAPDVPMIDLVVGGNERCGLSGEGGPARDAQLSGPNGLALDEAGGLYIADTVDYAVRRVDTTTGIITTVAGVLGVSGNTGDGGPATSALLSRPEGVIVAPDGDLYISDIELSTSRKVDNSTGLITTVAGTTPGGSGDGGPATAAQFYGPQGMAFDADGDLYIADRYNAAVRKIDMDTGIVTTVAGTLGRRAAPATAARRRVRCCTNPIPCPSTTPATFTSRTCVTTPSGRSTPRPASSPPSADRSVSRAMRP
jgi:streptogramin lyase